MRQLKLVKFPKIEWKRPKRDDCYSLFVDDSYVGYSIFYKIVIDKRWELVKSDLMLMFKVDQDIINYTISLLKNIKL